MRNMRAEGEVLSRTTLHPHSFAHLFLNLHPSLHHQPPSHGSKTPFPNPTSALSRLSYTPGSLYRCPPRPGIPAVCVSQTDGQFPFLAIFSRRWNIDKLHIERLLVGNTRMGMELPSCSGQYYPFRSLRAGLDSQCDRTGEPLIRTVQNDFRLLTLLRPELVTNVNEYGVCNG